MFNNKRVQVAFTARFIIVTSTLLSSILADNAFGEGPPAARPGSALITNPNMARIVAPSNLAQASSALVFGKASYATAGVALRNRRVGVVNISGVVKPVRAAYVYWAYLLGSAEAPSKQKLTLTTLPLTGSEMSVVVTGELLGVGADPCWSSNGIAVYRASVPTTFATGNGAYKIALSAPQSNLQTGEDPWDGNLKLPAAEGASLVLVGKGNYTVELYDSAIPSATTFIGTTYSYTLTLPATASGNSTLWDSIGADGQLGASRAASYPGKPTTINGQNISGTGGVDSDSDWDGAAGFPLPQLWDDEGHDITIATPAGTTSLTIGITSEVDSNNYADCISTIANVVAVQ
jgi:hypothetical protein